MSSSVLNTTSTFPFSKRRKDPSEFYDLEVKCDIKPNSTAELCEVVADGPDEVIGMKKKLDTCTHFQ